MDPRFIQLPDEVPTLASLPAGYRPENPDVIALREKVFEAIIPQTQNAPPALPLLKPSASVRQLLIEPKELTEILRQSFTDEELVTSRVAHRSGEHLKLSAALGTPTTSFCLRYRDGVPTDAVSASGVLSGTRRELARLAREVDDRLSNPKPIFLALDEREARLLAQVGLPLTSGAALQPVRVDRIRQFLKVRPRNQSRIWQPTIALWDLPTLKFKDRPTALTIVEQLAELARLGDLDVGLLFHAWCPSADDVARIRRAYNLNDQGRLASQLNASIARSCYPPEAALRVLRDREPVDFESGLRRVERVVEQSADFPLPGEADAALTSLDRAYDRQILAPLSGVHSGNGWNTSADSTVVQLARDWFEALDPVVQARRIRVGKNPASAGSADENFKRRLQLAYALVTLHRLNR